MASINRVRDALGLGGNVPATQGDVLEALRGAGEALRALVGRSEAALREQMKSLEDGLVKSVVRDPVMVAQVARKIAEVLPGEVSERVAELEERVAGWGEMESRVQALGDLFAVQQQALNNALKMLEGLSKAAEALQALAGKEQPPPVVNFQPPPPKLLEKLIEYDDLGRPWKTIEREAKGPGA